MLRRALLKTSLAAAGLGFALLPQWAAAQTVLTTSSWVPPSHLLTRMLAAWGQEVEKVTNGRVKVQMLPKAPAAAPGTFDAVRDGLVDIGYVTASYTPARHTLPKLAELPGGGSDAVINSVAYNRIYQKHFAPAGEHRGVKVLGVFTHGPGVIFNSKKPVNSSADAASLKFRIGGGNINELSKAMGWNTTLKAAPESFELLSTGVMDGTFFPDESITSFKLSMIKHATTFPGGLYNTSFVFMMNQDKYNKLSAQDKAVIDKLSGEHAARLFGEGWDRMDAASRDNQKAQGVQRIMADKAFVKAVMDKQDYLETTWAARAQVKGLKNPRAVLDEFRAEIKKVK